MGICSGSANRFVQLVVARASASDISDFLNKVNCAKRVEMVMALRGALVGRLFDLVADAEPLKLDDIVPPTTPAGASVLFEGRNSLAAFSRFQKRFTRTADGLIFGYNHQPLPLVGALTGPGYFRVVVADDFHAGQLLFDYTIPPPFEPDGWPAYRRNECRASRFVFMDLKDYVRKVADGVMVGSAFKKGVHQNVYFTLTARC